jgi:hypothetical protein
MARRFNALLQNRKFRIYGTANALSKKLASSKQAIKKCSWNDCLTWHYIQKEWHC